MRLREAIQNIYNEKLVSFHMPGHKNGQGIPASAFMNLAYDITEIPGSDHLHDPEGCILETEKAISSFYGSSESKILINGSTVGILSMIMGLTQPGDRILINRNAHKSVYNAIEIQQLTPVYYFLEYDAELGIPRSINIEKFDALTRDIKICLLTYPTYEGFCYEIDQLIDLCHKKGIPVVVDEAHGAHLILHKDGPKSALELGADVVVQSFHKTLPAMTQTACLHFSKSSILSLKQEDRIKWYLKSLQTSSPSYILMLSIDYMLDVMAQEGIEKSDLLQENMLELQSALKDLKVLEVSRFDHMDYSKFLLKIKRPFYEMGKVDGPCVSKLLRESYGIQVEYESTHFLLFMASMSNTSEDFIRVIKAINDLDDRYFDLYKDYVQVESLDDGYSKYKVFYDQYKYEEIYVCSAYEASRMDDETVQRDHCEGRVSAEYVIPYPPGIPILVPGESITRDVINLFPEELTHIRVLVM